VLDARRAGLGETREQYQQALEDAVEARSGAQLKIEVIRKTVAATQTRQVLDMVTANTAKAARLPDYGIARGCRADIVVRDALSVHEALRMQPLRRHVDQRRTRDRRRQDHAGVCEALEARIKAHRTGSSVVVETGSRPFVFIADVEKTYRARSRGLKAVDGVSLELGAGEFVSIIGPSGYGKSTLLMMTSGLITVSAGRIVIQGQPVHRTHTAV
jgi:ABC-type glutathione transport system ATPase component